MEGPYLSTGGNSDCKGIQGFRLWYCSASAILVRYQCDTSAILSAILVRYPPVMRFCVRGAAERNLTLYYLLTRCPCVFPVRGGYRTSIALGIALVSH